jgi:DNA-binding response OmpR family regulator
MNSRILVVNVEESVRDMLVKTLSLERYDVLAVESGEAAIDILQESSFDLVVLDLTLPIMGGMEVLKMINQVSPDTQVILYTGHGSLETAIEAFRLGARDYILKPASAEEILSSVARGLAKRAELRRKQMLIEQLDSSIKSLKDVEGIFVSTEVGHTVYGIENGVMVDFTRREVWRGGQRISLTPTEGKLMKVLIENRGRVLSHSELVLMVQSYNARDWEAPEILRPLISRLRRKLRVFPNGEKWIINVRGTGYIFDTGAEASGLN